MDGDGKGIEAWDKKGKGKAMNKHEGLACSDAKCLRKYYQKGRLRFVLEYKSLCMMNRTWMKGRKGKRREKNTNLRLPASLT